MVAEAESGHRYWYWWAWIGLGLLPLYFVMVVLAIRSGVFHFPASAPLDESEWRNILAFVAASLPVAATVTVSLIAHSREQRANDRLALDTVIAALGLMKDGSSPAASAGALATLVQLGHSGVALRALASAWDAETLDNGTAVWLLDLLYSSGSSVQQQEAASLLALRADKLTHPDENGVFDWPSCLDDAWLPSPPLPARIEILHAAVSALLSQDPDWWEDGFDWFPVLMYVVIRRDHESSIRKSAAGLAKVVLDRRDDSDDDAELACGLDWVTTRQIVAAVETSLAEPEAHRITALSKREDEIADWLSE